MLRSTTGEHKDNRMDIFHLRDQLTEDYANYASSFIQISDKRIYDLVFGSLEQGLFWPDPLIQLNPAFEPGAWVDDLLNKTPPEQVDARAEDALRAQLVIEAAIESWETGKVVEL